LQGVEVGFLAFKAAVEGADRGTDCGAKLLDRQRIEASRPQKVSASGEQRRGGLAAARLKRPPDAGQVLIEGAKIRRDELQGAPPK
jgi:hypothetical protein